MPKLWILVHADPWAMSTACLKESGPKTFHVPFLWLYSMGSAVQVLGMHPDLTQFTGNGVTGGSQEGLSGMGRKAKFNYQLQQMYCWSLGG